jgi:hypothetical protein
VLLYNQAQNLPAQFLFGMAFDVRIVQSTRFELVTQLKTMKALGLALLLPPLSRVDEVIE